MLQSTVWQCGVSQDFKFRAKVKKKEEYTHIVHEQLIFLSGNNVLQFIILPTRNAARFSIQNRTSGLGLGYRWVC